MDITRLFGSLATPTANDYNKNLPDFGPPGGHPQHCRHCARHCACKGRGCACRGKAAEVGIDQGGGADKKNTQKRNK